MRDIVLLQVTVAYNKDPSPLKVNLGVGAYRTEVSTRFLQSCWGGYEVVFVVINSVSLVRFSFIIFICISVASIYCCLGRVYWTLCFMDDASDS